MELGEHRIRSLLPGYPCWRTRIAAMGQKKKQLADCLHGTAAHWLTCWHRTYEEGRNHPDTGVLRRRSGTAWLAVWFGWWGEPLGRERQKPERLPWRPIEEDREDPETFLKGKTVRGRDGREVRLADLVQQRGRRLQLVGWLKKCSSILLVHSPKPPASSSLRDGCQPPKWKSTGMYLLSGSILFPVFHH